MPIRNKTKTAPASARRQSSSKAPSSHARTVTKVTRAPSTPTRINRSFSQAGVTSNFLAICREAIANNTRVFVKDRAGEFYLTLDPEKRYLTDPVIDVSAQDFKDHFSRFSSLIKDGLCFRLSVRGAKKRIYARRHTRYADPLDHVLDEWREQVAKAASVKQQEEKVLIAVKEAVQKGQLQSDEVLSAFQQLKKGIARLAIGHRPFDEGLLPESRYRMIDEIQE